VELKEALKEMGIDKVNFLSFMSNGQVEAMLRRENIINYLRTLQKLGM